MEKHKAIRCYENATSLHNKGMLEESLIYFKRALEYFQKTEDINREADIHLQIGKVYADQGNKFEARKSLDKARQLYRKKEDLKGQGEALISLGQVFEKNGDYDEARSYFEEARRTFSKTNDVQTQALAISLIAQTYESQEAWEDAILEYKRSAQLLKEEGYTKKSSYIEQIIDKMDEKRFRIKISWKEVSLALLYLLLLVFAEILITYSDMRLGMFIEALVLFGLLVNSSLKVSPNFSVLLRSMMALPIIRIVGLSIPIMQIPSLYWFPIISIPLFAATYTILRAQHLTLRNIGLIWGNIPFQILIAFTGFFLGVVEYFILKPQPLIPYFSWDQLIFAAIIIIISTGLAEELLFRGIIQKNAENTFGRFFGLLYTSLLFTAMHIGWNSIYDMIFVFLVAMFYGWVFMRSKSIVGITLSHGISNSILFLVMPFITFTLI